MMLANCPASLLRATVTTSKSLALFSSGGLLYRSPITNCCIARGSSRSIAFESKSAMTSARSCSPTRSCGITSLVKRLTSSTIRASDGGRTAKGSVEPDSVVLCACDANVEIQRTANRPIAEQQYFWIFVMGLSHQGGFARKSLAASSLCNLCVLCVSVVNECLEKINRRDTENTKVAQRNRASSSKRKRRA